MRADYDSQGDTLAITLVDTEHADYGDDSTPGAVVAIHDGHPVAVDILNASAGVERPLELVADHYGLDGDELLAAARSALAVPDREVVLEVSKPAA